MSIVSTLAGLKEKVDGDPEAIRGIASSLRTMGDHVSSSANHLTKSVSEVGKAWEGGSAEAFTSYMAAYPQAGQNLDGALSSCASALDTAATELETAYSTVSGLHTSASNLASDYQRNHDDATQDDIDRYVTEALGDPVGDANDAVTTAETALATAKSALDGQLGEGGFTFFKDIRQPGGADFQPGDNPVDWQRIAGYTPTTTLASADGGGHADYGAG
ncbi:WXG100 family type VII secretion target, partial [Nonomuraea turkmeniaca]